MISFSPLDRVEYFRSFNHMPYEEIPDEKFQEVQQKILALQSENPLVSVVLIAWNEEDHIFATLASLAETRADFPLEIIVVNNNSTDDTQKFIEGCGVKAVMEKRQGYAFARQAGLEVAKGMYVVSGDTDTLYPETWVAAMIEPLIWDKKVLVTYSLSAFYKEDGNYGPGLYLYEFARLLSVYFKNFKRPHLNCRGFSMAFQKDAANKVGGYNTKIHRGSDGYLAIELSDYGKVKLLTSNKARVYTNMRRTQMDGSLFQAFMKRFAGTMRYFFHMFTTQKNR